MKHHGLVLLAAAAACLAAGCAVSRAMPTGGPQLNAPGRAGGEAVLLPADKLAGIAPLAGPDRGQPAPAPHMAVLDQRKIVYKAALTVVVDRIAPALEQTRRTAERMDGYMQRMTGEAIVIRVPAEQFEQCLAAIADMGVVINKDITARDVTEQYIDLKIRLSNAKALRQKLIALLDRAKNVKEALAVEKELARVRTEIETLEGRVKRLSNQVAYSTISVTFRKYANAPSQLMTHLPFGWLRTLGVEPLLGLNSPRRAYWERAM